MAVPGDAVVPGLQGEDRFVETKRPYTTFREISRKCFQKHTFSSLRAGR